MGWDDSGGFGKRIALRCVEGGQSLNRRLM